MQPLKAMRSRSPIPPRSRLSCQGSRKQSRPCDLVAQRVESVVLRHGLTKPGFVLPHSTPNGPCPGKAAAAAQYLGSAPTTVRTSVMMLRSAPRMATSGRLPECSIRLRTSLPHDRPAIRASMSRTSTKGRATSVHVSRESPCTPACCPQTRPPSATAHLGCSRGSTPCESLGIDDATVKSWTGLLDT